MNTSVVVVVVVLNRHGGRDTSFTEVAQVNTES